MVKKTKVTEWCLAKDEENDELGGCRDEDGEKFADMSELRCKESLDEYCGCDGCRSKVYLQNARVRTN